MIHWMLCFVCRCGLA